MVSGGGAPLASAGPIGNKATLKYYDLPAGGYVILVTGTATAPARGYYSFQVKVN